MDISDKSLIVCSIVRNAGKNLRRNSLVINQLCMHFKDYKIIVFENDSTDDTKEVLKEWHNINPKKIHVKIDDFGSSQVIPSIKESGNVNPFFSNKRISKMAHLRNQYLNYIETHGLQADYVLIVDLDVCRISLKGILDSFDKSDQWDIVTAFGYSRSPSLRIRYHDTYALALQGSEYVPQTEMSIQELAITMSKQCRKSSKLIPVDSAFGGLSIYKFDAIKGFRYNVVYNEDSRVEVRCEHYSLNRQAANRGYNRIFINPRMKLLYQKISFNIILRRIKSLLFNFRTNCFK